MITWRGRQPADTMSQCRRSEPVYLLDCVSNGVARMAALQTVTELMAANGGMEPARCLSWPGDAVTINSSPF
jgi:hypothetical protein